MGVSDKKIEKFDPIIVGPWMDLWDLVTRKGSEPVGNKHVERYLASPPSTRSIERYVKANNW